MMAVKQQIYFDGAVLLYMDLCDVAYFPDIGNGTDRAFFGINHFEGDI